jgi:acyl carrier protein
VIAEKEVREKLKDWLIQNSKVPDLKTVADNTKIIEERIITSMQTFDLITFIERLRGESIDLSDAKPGTFDSIDTIFATFFNHKNGDS